MKTKLRPQEYPKHPFLLPIHELAELLNTDLHNGLVSLDAQIARQHYGLNRLDGESGVKWWPVLVKQISNAMILVRIPLFETADSIGHTKLYSKIVK